MFYRYLQCTSYLLGCVDPRPATLRRLRDEVLSTTEGGRTLIGLFYESTAVLSDLFESNPGLKSRARERLEAVIPIIGNMLKR